MAAQKWVGLVTSENSESNEPQKQSVEILLNRTPEDSYRQEWTSNLMTKAKKRIDKEIVSLVIFRLNTEWLALPIYCLKEVFHHRLIHRVPHKHGKILMGLINLRGELQLCINLKRLLDIEESAEKIEKPVNSNRPSRMIAINKEEALWVFPVDEVGIDVWNMSELKNIPVNLSKSSTNYLKGIMTKGSRSVGLIDEELLFYSLRRQVM